MNVFEKMEEEISSLERSDFVQLAIQADSVCRARSKYLGWLRTMELRGRELAKEGISEEYLEDLGGNNADP